MNVPDVIGFRRDFHILMTGLHGIQQRVRLLVDCAVSSGLVEIDLRTVVSGGPRCMRRCQTRHSSQDVIPEVKVSYWVQLLYSSSRPCSLRYLFSSKVHAKRQKAESYF